MNCQVTLLYGYFQGFSQHFFMFREGNGPKSSYTEVINVTLMSDSIFGFMTCTSALCFKYLDVRTFVNPLQFTHPSTLTLSVAVSLLSSSSPYGILPSYFHGWVRQDMTLTSCLRLDQQFFSSFSVTE